MNARQILVMAIAAAALLAGCGGNRDEDSSVTKITEYTEPSSATPRPSTSRPTTTTTTPTSTSAPTPPPAGEVLPPSSSGYVYIETKSGQTRCQIDTDSVGCEAPFTNSPLQNGVRTNGVNLSADGRVQWILGNLGDIPTTTIDYRTYSAVGWTIDATSEGTRFTNEATKHGMFVSIEKVDTF
jgi:hypothetical protein